MDRQAQNPKFNPGSQSCQTQQNVPESCATCNLSSAFLITRNIQLQRWPGFISIHWSNRPKQTKPANVTRQVKIRWVSLLTRSTSRGNFWTNHQGRKGRVSFILGYTVHYWPVNRISPFALFSSTRYTYVAGPPSSKPKAFLLPFGLQLAQPLSLYTVRFPNHNPKDTWHTCVVVVSALRVATYERQHLQPCFADSLSLDLNHLSDHPSSNK